MGLAERRYGGGELGHGLGEFRALSGGDPFQTDALLLHAEVFEHREQQRHTAAGEVVAAGVVAVTGVQALRISLNI